MAGDDGIGPHDMAPAAGGIRGRDSEVLRVLEEEDLTSFTFEGLKRRMGAHPETLSRTLDRLEEQDIVTRFEGAYSLTSKGKELLGTHPVAESQRRLSLVTTMLPYNIPIDLVLSALEGKWFGQLRWLGRTETPSETVLKWITADGKVQLDGIITRGELKIEGRLLRGEDIVGAIKASHDLLSHISRSYSQPRKALMYGTVPTSFMQN